jgi:DNA-binding MarR family transcriptional regulator
MNMEPRDLRRETEIELMKQILAELKAAYVSALEANDIKNSHAGFLVLMEPGRSYKAVELAREYGVSPSAVSHALRGLTDEGLVERRPGEDLRSVSIELTPTGVATRQRVIACLEEMNADLLSALDPDERACFRRVLRKLITRVQSAEVFN